VDLTQESLIGAMGKIIAFAKANKCELTCCKFDPSGQACAKEVESCLDSHALHNETTASSTKQEMPVAEQSNATFSQGARANLAGVQVTSHDGGGRDKNWRDALFFLAGCEAIRMTTHPPVPCLGFRGCFRGPPHAWSDPLNNTCLPRPTRIRNNALQHATPEGAGSAGNPVA
jgi:hypothetical protein